VRNKFISEKKQIKSQVVKEGKPTYNEIGEMSRMSLSETFKQAVEAKKEELKEAIAGMEMVVQLKIEDKPEENYYVEISGGEIKVEKGEHSNPTVTFIATTETFNKIVSGELDGTAAYMSGQLKIEGSLSDAMAFGNLLQKLAP